MEPTSSQPHDQRNNDALGVRRAMERCWLESRHILVYGLPLILALATAFVLGIAVKYCVLLYLILSLLRG